MSENWKKQKDKDQTSIKNFFPNSPEMGMMIDERLGELRETIEKKRKLKLKYEETAEILQSEIYTLNMNAGKCEANASEFTSCVNKCTTATTRKLYTFLAVQERENALKLKSIAAELDRKRVGILQESYKL